MKTAARTLFILVILVNVGGAHAQVALTTGCNAPAKAPIAYVSVPGHPTSTVLTANGCWLFVSIQSPNPRQEGGVAVFERHGNDEMVLKRVVPIVGGTWGAVMTHDGELLIAANDEFVVFLDVERMIRGTGDPLVGYLSDGPGAGSIFVNVTSDDTFLFVSDEQQETITVINLKKARTNGYDKTAIVGRIPVGSAPVALTFSTDGKLLYTTSQNGLKKWEWPPRCEPEQESPVLGNIPRAEGAIVVIDVDKAKVDPEQSVIARVPAGCNPVRLGLMPDGRFLWVTVRKDNAVAVFDTAKLLSDPTHAKVGLIPVGTAPVGLTITRDGKYVVTTNSNRFGSQTGTLDTSQTLNVIDPKRIASGAAAIVSTIPAGLFPRQFGQSPDGKTLFLANARSNNIEIIDVERLLTNSPDARNK